MTKALPWYRMYVETVEDKKLRRLPASQRWLWVALLALARTSPVEGVLLLTDGVPVTVDDMADAAAIRRADATAGVKAFHKLGMLHRDGALLVVSNWDKRQFASDVSTERVQRYRERLRNGKGNSQETVSETGV